MTPKLLTTWTLPRVGRFQDDYDGMHLYREVGDREERFAVSDEYAEKLRRAFHTGDLDSMVGEVPIMPAKIPAAAHVLERNRPRERRRIEKALFRQFRKYRNAGISIGIDWSGPTPHTGYQEMNKTIACVSVLNDAGAVVEQLLWDGTRLTPGDLNEVARRCGCPDCQEYLASLPPGFGLALSVPNDQLISKGKGR